MGRRGKFARICILLAFSWRVAFALERPGEIEGGTNTNQLQTVEVIGQRFRSDILVFDKSEIRKSHADSLASFLVRYAGFHVDRATRSGGYSAMYMRGADPSHVVVIVDGVRINDQLSSRGSAVNLNTLSLDGVERIEVERGPAAIFEREALAGVVRIYTNSDPADRATVDGGGHESRGIAAQGNAEGMELSAIWRKDGRGGLQGKSEVRTAAVDHSPSAPMPLRFHLRASSANLEGAPDDSGGARYAVIQAPETLAHDTIEASVETDWNLSTHKLLVFGRFYDQTGTERNPGVAPGIRDAFGLPKVTSDQDYRRFEIGSRFSSNIAAGWETDVGLDAQWELGELNSLIDIGFPLPARFKISRRAVSLEGYARRKYQRLTAELGARVEDDGSSGFRFNPAASIRIEPTEFPGSISLSAGRAETSPSFYALGHPIVGNPNLRSEIADNYSVDIKLRQVLGFEGSIAIYQSNYVNLIDFDEGPPPRLVNRDRVSIYGAEIQASRALGQSTYAFAQASVQRFQVKEDIQLRQRPKGLASVGLDYSHRDWQTTGTVQWTAKRFDSSVPTGDVVLPSYVVVDFSVERTFGHLRVYVAIDNALDRDYQLFVGDVSNGRRVRVGLGYEF